MYKHLNIIKMNMKIKREYGISLHYKIRKEIEKLLKEENFKDKIIPPEEEIAERFKVSRGTVRRAIFDLVNQGVLYRIPGKGTFINNKQLSIEKITVFSPWYFHNESEISQNTYEDILLRELRKEATKNGYTILLKNWQKEEIEYAEVTKESSGIIVLNPKRNDNELINRLSKYSIPSVVIGANLERKDINYVASDNKGGMRQAVEYLISLGHKNIFFIGGSIESHDTYERYEEFMNYCKKRKIQHNEVILESNFDWSKEVEKILEENLKEKNLATAFITGGITLSLYLIDALKKADKKIPDDISLIGFDEFPICSHITPPLTTIYQPIELLAKKGFEILEEEKKKKNKKRKQVILETKLIIRESVKRR